MADEEKPEGDNGLSSEVADLEDGGGEEEQSTGASSTDSIKGVDVSRMKMILDVPLKVSVELGRTKLLVNDILQLGQGSVIELDKMAGEPMEIYVNDKLIAMGEVVVVNEKFGVRLTDVMSGVGYEEAHAKDTV
jgi:flagellar motor switch protein FliN